MHPLDMKAPMKIHSTKRHRASLSTLGALALISSLTVLPSTQAIAQAVSTEAAKDALAKREGDADSATVLKETLSASDKQYSLLHEGKRALTYDLTYSYIGQQLINANFADSKLTNFSIQNTRGHTVTNTFSGDYGLKDNLTVNLTVPIVSKFSQSDTNDQVVHGFGDVSVGARLQPFPLSRTLPSITVNGTVRLPTGRSPFEVIEGQGLSTGAGYTSATLGLNASKVIDPVAIFGSANVTFGLPAKNLDQKSNGNTLYEVTPGQTVGFGVGFAYAMSYNITTTLSFQESISGSTRLKYIDATGKAVENKTASQTSAMMNLGLGVRVSPLTTMNFSVGIGLTSDSPDFTFGMNMPLNF
jgi:hypothetical protein